MEKEEKNKGEDPLCSSNSAYGLKICLFSQKENQLRNRIYNVNMNFTSPPD